MNDTTTPKILVSPEDQAMARYMRNRQWETLERIAEHNPLWICWWDKNRRHAKHDRRPDDLIVHGLITGMELANTSTPNSPVSTRKSVPAPTPASDPDQPIPARDPPDTPCPHFNRISARFLYQTPAPTAPMPKNQHQVPV